MEQVSLQKILTSVSGDRLLLKQWWTISLMVFIHREDTRSLWRARKRWQEGQLTSCIVTLIIICCVEHVHTTGEDATAAWMDSCWALFSGNIVTAMQYQQVAAWDLGCLFWSSAMLSPCCWSYRAAGICLKLIPRLLSMLWWWATPQVGSQTQWWVASCFWYSMTTPGSCLQPSSTWETGINSPLKILSSHGTTTGFLDQLLVIKPSTLPESKGSGHSILHLLQLFPELPLAQCSSCPVENCSSAPEEATQQNEYLSMMRDYQGAYTICGLLGK